MSFKNKILNYKHNKILGIGMPKTGTTSLKRALEILGYRTVHSPRQYTYAQSLNIPFYKWEEAISIFKNKDILKKFPEVKKITKDLKFSDWDAMVNFGEHIYPILDSKLLNSKFILTVRDKDLWLKSVENFFNNCPLFFTQDEKGDGIIGMIRRVHLFQYVSYNKDYFSILYDNHLKGVKYYFKNRTNDLLIIDICNGEGWGKLCNFLNKETPMVPFPHRNKTTF